MALETRPYDTAEHLKTPQDIALYIEAVLEDGDPALIASAVGDIARARGMAQIAAETGRSQESLYGALYDEADPQTGTLADVLRAVGRRLGAEPVAGHRAGLTPPHGAQITGQGLPFVPPPRPR